MPFTRLAHNLYIASIDEVAETSTANFDTVISVCQDTVEDNVSVGLARDADSGSTEAEEVGCSYHHFPLADDRESQRNWGGSIAYDDFVRAAEKAIASVQSGRTLIHCHKGRNRSAAICAAVLASVYDYGFAQAIDRVRRLNSRTKINYLMYNHARQFVKDYNR